MHDSALGQCRSGHRQKEWFADTRQQCHSNVGMAVHYLFRIAGGRAISCWILFRLLRCRGICPSTRWIVCRKDIPASSRGLAFLHRLITKSRRSPVRFALFCSSTYAEYEIIVVNDGSKDRTLDVLIREFSLARFPEVYQMRIPTKTIRDVYRSEQYPNLRVVDKENGGKADALNAGINLSKYSLFCSLDADSIVQRDSLQRIVQPFLHDPTTVACGGTIRIANGCEVSGGFRSRWGCPAICSPCFRSLIYPGIFLRPARMVSDERDADHFRRLWTLS